MSERIVCPFCEEKIECEKFPSNHYLAAKCPICGDYLLQYNPTIYGSEIKDKVSIYLYHKRNLKSSNNTIPFIGSKECYEKNFYLSADVSYVSSDEIASFYPTNIAERISKTLITLADISEYLGDIITFDKKQLSLLCFVKQRDNKEKNFLPSALNDQIYMFWEHLAELNYIRYSDSGTGKYHITLKPQGWQRVDELQRNSSKNSKNVFVAMSFAKEACIVEPREAVFYQRALDLAKRLNLADDIQNFERKVKYFRV